MRLAWAQRIRDLLKPGGELITLMFPVMILIPQLIFPTYFLFVYSCLHVKKHYHMIYDWTFRNLTFFSFLFFSYSTILPAFLLNSHVLRILETFQFLK